MFELNGNPKLDALKVDQSTTSSQPGGNFEGKEIRNGTPASALWAASTTGTSNGSVNSMHDSVHAARRHDAAAPHAAR